MGVIPPPRRRARLTARQRQRLTRWLTYALTAAIVLVVLVSADWGLLRETFLDPDIFADLFPDIVTVAAKNTVILALLAFPIVHLFSAIMPHHLPKITRRHRDTVVIVPPRGSRSSGS